MRSRMTRRELFCKWACACARYPDHSLEVGKDVGNVPLSWEAKDMVGERPLPPVFFFAEVFIWSKFRNRTIRTGSPIYLVID